MCERERESVGVLRSQCYFLPSSSSFLLLKEIPPLLKTFLAILKFSSRYFLSFTDLVTDRPDTYFTAVKCR